MKKLHSLISEQKEDARHGESFFPIQKYITSFSPEYPVLTTHWPDRFTLISEGKGIYHIDLTEYETEPEDLIFVPPLALHSASSPEGCGLVSETYVFHMNFLGGNSTDICSTRYLQVRLSNRSTRLIFLCGRFSDRSAICTTVVSPDMSWP